jgi:predicted DNA-binding protein (MmcQ/YjbR family)
VAGPSTPAAKPVTGAEAQSFCLAKPGATPDQPWEEDYVTKVGGKIFAFHGEDSVGLKCGRDRDEADELLAAFPDSVAPMAYIGRFGWNTVRLDGTVPTAEIRALIDASYDAVVAKLPKAKRPS